MSFFVVTINFLCGFTITLSLFITNLFNNTSVPILVLSSSPNINSYVEPEKVKSNFTIVRGLAYYSDFIVETNLNIKVTNNKGKEVDIGSICSGGAYAKLISRFRIYIIQIYN